MGRVSLVSESSLHRTPRIGISSKPNLSSQVPCCEFSMVDGEMNGWLYFETQKNREMIQIAIQHMRKVVARGYG